MTPFFPLDVHSHAQDFPCFNSRSELGAMLFHPQISCEGPFMFSAIRSPYILVWPCNFPVISMLRLGPLFFPSVMVAAVLLKIRCVVVVSLTLCLLWSSLHFGDGSLFIFAHRHLFYLISHSQEGSHLSVVIHVLPQSGIWCVFHLYFGV